jgi:coniferyl-aldehyde dehydrogenase
MARLPFDHLLFTGSTERGREVMRAAAEHLTPLTLELGGKCPAILMPDADLTDAARSLVLGKALNAGQTCVAPDTLLVVGPRPLAEVREALARAHARHYPDGLPTAVPAAQRRRLEQLAAGTVTQPLGDPGRPHLSVAKPPPGSPLLCQEVFAPVLPLMAVDDLAAALAWVRNLPSPLAVYLFTADRAAEERVLAGTRAGALVVNGAVVQAAMETLPFGGVGASGFGRYHGRAGFDTFSNLRVHLRTARASLSRLLDPPYGSRKQRLIERLLGR